MSSNAHNNPIPVLRSVACINKLCGSLQWIDAGNGNALFDFIVAELKSLPPAIKNFHDQIVANERCSLQKHLYHTSWNLLRYDRLCDCAERPEATARLLALAGILS